MFFAYIYAALDQRDQAVNMLAQAYLETDVNLISLRTNKLLDTLRLERRFQDPYDASVFRVSSHSCRLFSKLARTVSVRRQPKC